MPLITRFLAFMTTILVCVTERTCFFIAVNLYNFSKPELSLWGGGKAFTHLLPLRQLLVSARKLVSEM